MKLACITGASSGIGKEMAIILSNLGYALILVSRNTNALNELADNLPTRCKCITCDLSDEKSCVMLGKQLRRYKLDIFINNAGFGELGRFNETRLKNDVNMINVNIKAVHILTKAVLPGFIKRDHGYIMNVASSAGLMPAGPYMSTYYATKAYVTSLTASIYQELKDMGSHVHISMLCPGPVDTNFNSTANVAFSLKGISAKYCASYALKQMFANKLTIIPTFTMKAACLGIRLIPRPFTARIVSHQQRKKSSELL
ncbi:MAG: SDR family NAD(P)-dependent oxidoreductase [Lachnospira sp.]